MGIAPSPGVRSFGFSLGPLDPASEERIRRLQAMQAQDEAFTAERIAEAQAMPDYVPAPGAGANRSAIQSQRAFNPDGTARPRPDFDELAQQNRSDVVAGRKGVNPNWAWSKYGNTQEEAVENLKKRMSAQMGIEYESEPEEAPLPGEETLPPAVAAQNHRLARSGGGVVALNGLGGMSDLDRVKAMQDGVVTQDEIDASLGRQQDATDARHSRFERTMLGQSDAERKAGPRAAAKPMPPKDPVEELNRERAQAQNAYYRKHGKFVEEAQRDLVSDDRKKNQFFQTVSGRFGQQMQRAGMDVREMESIYDAAAAEGGHLAGVRAVNAVIDGPGGLRNARDLQLQANVDRRNEQIAQTQAMRDPRRGAAMFYQALANAQTPDDQAKVLMLAHYHQPNMGWGQAASMLQRGEMDARAMSQWAQAQAAMREPPKPTGPQAVAQDVQNALNNVGPGTVASLQQIAVQANPGAKPDQIQNWMTLTILPAAQQIVSQRRPLTIHEKALVRAAIPQPRYLREFAQQIGIDEKDPQIVALYKDIYGVEPQWAPFRAAWDAVAGMMQGNAGGGQAQAAGK